MDTQLQLPPETRHSRTVVDRCEWRIRWFVEHDAYVMYDYWITTREVPPDVVTRDHLIAINNAMRARARVEPWERFLERAVPELNAIAPDLDLMSSPDREVELGLSALRAVCARITSISFITDMAFSKVFHLLRPGFVPISDTYVRLCLGVPESEPVPGADRGSFYAARLERVARTLRQFGRANPEALERLKDFADTLPSVRPESGPFRGQQIPVRLSRVRLLDMLLWTEVAIYGLSPHAAWLEAHRRAFGEPTDVAKGDGALTAGTAPNARTGETALPDVNSVHLFKDDDGGYIEWLSRHPTGLVVNCERSPRPTYLVLHRATCGTISGRPARGLVWTGPYLKVCAMSAAPLSDWSFLATGGTSQGCKLCRP